MEVEPGHRLEIPRFAHVNGNAGVPLEHRRHRVRGRGCDGHRVDIEAALVEQALDRQAPFRDKQALALQGGGVTHVTIGSEFGICHSTIAMAGIAPNYRGA